MRKGLVLALLCLSVACAGYVSLQLSSIFLTADLCLMAMSGLRHQEHSDCCTLCSLTWQLKMIYKWSFQFQTESSKRLQYSLWYQRHPAIPAAAAFAFTARLSLGFYVRCLFSKGCFVRVLCRARRVSGAESASWRQWPLSSKETFGVFMRLLYEYPCKKWEGCEGGQVLTWRLVLTISQRRMSTFYFFFFLYCHSIRSQGLRLIHGPFGGCSCSSVLSNWSTVQECLDSVQSVERNVIL